MLQKAKYYYDIGNSSLRHAARICFKKVFRSTLTEPGFMLLNLGSTTSSQLLRTTMVKLKKELSNLTTHQFSSTLNYQWLGRFDQQHTTKFHLDNAADQSYLMLGYEPSEIQSELFIADYSKYAMNHTSGLNTFFEHFNPLSEKSDSMLASHATQIDGFTKSTCSILIVNNSNCNEANKTLGVMHKSVIPKPNKSHPRVINSMMLSMEEAGSKEQIPPSTIEAFMNTTELGQQAI